MSRPHVVGSLVAAPAAWAGVFAVAGMAAALLFTGRTPNAAMLGAPLYRDTVIEGDTFPRTLIDPLGIAQTLPAPPQRIASSVLLADEMLTALVSPDRFVAVTHLIDDPAISNCVALAPPDAERISPDIERLLALQPDLVVVADYTRAESVRFLLSVGIPVLRFGHYHSFADVMTNLRTAGAAVGADAAAAALVADAQARIAAVETRVSGRPRPRVLYYIPGGFTSGPGTLMDEIIERAGGRNVVRETGLEGQTPIGLEVAIGLAPEVLLVPNWRPGADTEPIREIVDDPLWAVVPAVRDGRVHVLNSAETITVSHYAVNGFEQVAHILHPEAFDS